ncbi:pyruvate kinase [Chloroflexia bacterium SDU3-3]|nr:pyruvate kinase [Chloroflexia bacterium SDU3-3]
MRRTKIVATIGPSSSTPATIEQLIEAGVDVVRLNFSHGSHETHAEWIRLLREAAKRADKPLAILQDLQGPKIRTGPLVNHKPVILIPGNTFVITTVPVDGTSERVSTTYQALPHDVKPNDRVLLSDGLIELRVLHSDEVEVATEVIFGGELREHQGINLPGVNISAPALTEKDLEDLAFGLEHGVDYVALSFVRRARDVIQTKERMAALGYNVPLVSKIEKPEALDDLAAILDASDAIMVARGDLGVEIPTEQVPLVQKHLIEAANAVGKPVIIATQMLDSMIRNPRPTRAETSDVANAIIDGTDAVMLSGETANGSFPLESVRMMARIADVTESGERRGDILPVHIDARKTSFIEPRRDIADAISAASVAIIHTLKIKAIVAFTMSGNTARAVAQLRPEVPIFAFTPNEKVYHQLNLVWGIEPILCEFTSRLDDLQAMLERIVVSRGMAKVGDRLVMTGGHPIASRGATNFLKVFDIRPQD